MDPFTILDACKNVCVYLTCFCKGIAAKTTIRIFEKLNKANEIVCEHAEVWEFEQAELTLGDSNLGDIREEDDSVRT